MTRPIDRDSSRIRADSPALFDLPGHHAGRYEQLMQHAINEAIAAGRLDTVAAAAGGALAIAAGEGLDLAVAAGRGGTVSQVLMSAMDIMRDYRLIPPAAEVSRADEAFWHGIQTTATEISDAENVD